MNQQSLSDFIESIAGFWRGKCRRSNVPTKEAATSAYAAKSAISVSLTLFVVAAGMVGSETASAAQLPDGFERIEAAAPSSSFQDPEGKTISLRAFQGRVVILNLWATWCAPCVRELPSLNRLAEKLDKNRAVVLAVSQDKGGAAIAKPYLEKLDVPNLAAHADPTGRLSREFGARGLPTTIIIDEMGRVVARAEGALEWDTDNVVNYLNSVRK